MHIPIKNIYYLLSYAWNRLDERDRVAVDIDDKTELLDLFAKILINATKILLKRGIDRNYVERSEHVFGIKGKFEVSQTVKTSSMLSGRTVCTFDNYSENILLNQILVSTLWKLVKTKALDSQPKGNIKGLLWKLSGISRIELTARHFSAVKLNRNNSFYGFVVDVCKLIFENTLPSEDEGEWNFSDFTRNEHKMNQLFERFVFNFYKIEQEEFRVRRENIKWAFDSLVTDGLKYLPKMETDITLESGKRKIIIDAKYYRETMSSYFGGQKIKSANLYQIFSYLINQQTNDQITQTATGILLYPTIEEEFDLNYSFDDHIVRIKTINLNASWKEVDLTLRELVD